MAKFSTESIRGSEVPVLDAPLDKTCRAVWVSSGGTLVIVLDDDSIATLDGVPTGVMLPLAIKQFNTGTTATVVALR